ncbi:NrfD/PsrC family molybdoenzyme membrane anchor subunit [Thioalkalivibrio sulfidiphilus]|uniref:NrfD/PsrC family molybdoenzyme membrane anchor subunit n=1 Tax=Thioalkalivibrio sulfidiphilus TaxID=1033854 RepID=UPI0003810D29|nr:NrfD/PsrC family molybdoenzyme membrane anchor subunit [Thioalkalivibrio sulfidiphilus]
MSTRAESVLPEHSPGSLPIGILLAGLVLVAIGLVGVSNLLTQGHSAFNTGSSGVVWGLPVSAYVFFVLSSTGLTFVASVAMVFGIKAFYPIAKRCVWLALATLIAGFISLGLEIGHPLRMIWAIPLNLQVRSPMFWMGAFYFLYMFFLIWKFSYLQRNDWDSPASRNVGIASFVTVIIAHATLGLVFGMMAMRPFWYGSFVPVYFLATAALSGLAFAVLFTYLSHGTDTSRMEPTLRELMERFIPKIFALVLGVVLVFHLSRTITGLWSNNPEISLVMEYQVGTWLFHLELWLGMVLPFILLLLPGMRVQPMIQVLSAVLVLMAVFIGRYEYVVGGQIIPLWKGTWYPDFIAYTPSFTEWGLVALGGGIGLLIYAFGSWKFNLREQPRHL